MNIAETIYQHVKSLPVSKALEVLHFVELLESKPNKVGVRNMSMVRISTLIGFLSPGLKRF